MKLITIQNVYIYKIMYNIILTIVKANIFSNEK